MKKVLDNVYSWGYMLDAVPSQVPFIEDRAICSLETAADYLGTKNIMYMNSMYGKKFYENFLKAPNPATITMHKGLAENHFSDNHFARLAKFDSVICALEHHNYIDSAREISRLSRKYKNIKGALFDDFNVPSMPHTQLAPEQLCEIRAALRSENPELKLYLISFDYQDPSEYEKYLDGFDVMTRWSWIQDPLYYEYYWRELRELKNVLAGREILQGIYFAGHGPKGGIVDLDYFKLSVKTLASNVTWNALGGMIIPSPGYFSNEKYRKHVQWLKNYLAWQNDTVTIL